MRNVLTIRPLRFVGADDPGGPHRETKSKHGFRFGEENRGSKCGAVELVSAAERSAPGWTT